MNSAGRAAGRPEFGRRSMFRRAAIVSEDGAQTPCIVTDISDDAAVLKVDDTIELPKRFGLIIEEDDFTVHCEIVARTRSRVNANSSVHHGACPGSGARLNS
jgi:hypothetical protein